VINRLFLNTTLGTEIIAALADFPFPALRTAIRNRQEYAKSARNGLTALETDPNGPAATEIRALATEILAALDQSHQIKERVHVAR
jgi:chromosome partitioning protein